MVVPLPKKTAKGALEEERLSKVVDTYVMKFSKSEVMTISEATLYQLGALNGVLA